MLPVISMTTDNQEENEFFLASTPSYNYEKQLLLVCMQTDKERYQNF